MTPAELLAVTEALGLTQEAAARYLGVSGRTVRHWVEGRYAVPAGVADELEDLERATEVAVEQVVTALQDERDPGIAVYRTDEDMWAARPESGRLPARWWRVVAYRAACEVPGTALVFAGDEA